VSVVGAVARHELRQVATSRDYLVPLGLLATLFFVIIPFLLLTAITRVSDDATLSAVGVVLGSLPKNAVENIAGSTREIQAAYALAVYLLAPIAIVVPLTIATAVGAGAIVGERERGTGEFLAHTPITDRQLYLGKLVASLIPGLAITAIGFTIYSLIVNTVVGPEVGGWFFPTLGWWLLIFWVVPPFLTTAMALIVALSGRARSVTAAQQSSQLVTLPVILMAYAVSTGLVFNEVVVAVTVGTLAWVSAAVAVSLGSRAISRGKLIGSG
jgi:ABC-2 type transport system permease protein